MILIHSHLSTTMTVPVRYCCPALDSIVQACAALNLAGFCKRIMSGFAYLTVMLMLFKFFLFFNLVLRLRLCWLNEARSKALLDWFLTWLVTIINIWARKPSCVCNESTGRAVLKCKGLEHFVCQPEFKKKLVEKGGNEVGRVLHVIPKTAVSASQCIRWFLFLQNPNFGS